MVNKKNFATTFYMDISTKKMLQELTENSIKKTQLRACQTCNTVLETEKVNKKTQSEIMTEAIHFLYEKNSKSLEGIHDQEMPKMLEKPFTL
jgi:hypothetical protein